MNRISNRLSNRISTLPQQIAPVMARIKPYQPYLRWVILGAALFFLAKVILENWQAVASLRIEAEGFACLAIALGVTLLAHICAGWVWSRILTEFRQPVNPLWIIQTYLKTNIAKYLPGNVWHYYGRIQAAHQAGAQLGAATVSVLLEPLLMVAAALLVASVCGQAIALVNGGWVRLILQVLLLAGVLVAIRPRTLNPVIQTLSRLKARSSESASTPPFQLRHYPTIPLLGEIGFLLLRGFGFLMTFRALSPMGWEDAASLLGGFSLAWLLGLVVPGAPGGLGVFEATAIALLGRTYAPAVLLSVVALYRLISVLAEAGGMGLASLEPNLENGRE